MGWFGNYQKRYKHTIYGSPDKDLYNYPMTFWIERENPADYDLSQYWNDFFIISPDDINDDFSDIAFTADDGVTKLDHFMAIVYDGWEAIFYVKIPYIPKNRAVTIYLYYKDPSLAGISNVGDPTKVSIDGFSDDFNTGSLDTSKWEVFGNPYIDVWGTELSMCGAGGFRSKHAFTLGDGLVFHMVGFVGPDTDVGLHATIEGTEDNTLIHEGGARDGIGILLSNWVSNLIQVDNGVATETSGGGPGRFQNFAPMTFYVTPTKIGVTHREWYKYPDDKKIEFSHSKLNSIDKIKFASHTHTIYDDFVTDMIIVAEYVENPPTHGDYVEDIVKPISITTVCPTEVPPKAKFTKDYVASFTIEKGTLYNVIASNYPSPQSIPLITTSKTLGSLDCAPYYDFYANVYDWEYVPFSDYSYKKFKIRYTNKSQHYHITPEGKKVLKFAGITGADWSNYAEGFDLGKSRFLVNDNPIDKYGAKTKFGTYTLNVDTTFDLDYFNNNVELKGYIKFNYVILESYGEFILNMDVDLKTSKIIIFDSENYYGDRVTKAILDHLMKIGIVNLKADFSETKLQEGATPFLEGQYIDPVLGQDSDQVYKVVYENATTVQQLNRFARYVNWVLAPKEWVELHLKKEDLTFSEGDTIFVDGNVYRVVTISYNGEWYIIRGVRKLQVESFANPDPEKLIVDKFKNLGLKKGILLNQDDNYYYVQTENGQLEIPISKGFTSGDFVYWL